MKVLISKKAHNTYSGPTLVSGCILFSLEWKKREY